MVIALFENLIKVCPGRLINGVWYPDESATNAQIDAANYIVNNWSSIQVQYERDQLTRRAFEIAGGIISDVYPDHAPVDILAWSIDPNNAGNTAFLTALQQCRSWMNSVKDRAKILAIDIQAGNRSTVNESDFSDLDPAPYTYLQLLTFN